jgi:hypothetical protein
MEFQSSQIICTSSFQMYFIRSTQPHFSLIDPSLIITILTPFCCRICTTKQWSLAATTSFWNILKTWCVYNMLTCFSIGHDVLNSGVLWILIISAFNSSCPWHSKVISNQSQNSTKLNFRWIKQLKNKFKLSDIEVVLRSPARGISVKYAKIHEEWISYLLAKHSFPWKP